MSTTDEDRIRQLMGEIALTCDDSPQSPRRPVALILWLVTLLCVSGAAGLLIVRDMSTTSSEEERKYVSFDGSAAVPYSSLVDWLSYGDAIVIFTVESERDYQPAEDEVARGEGLIPRAVTVRVTDVVWHRTSERRIPEDFEYLALPWIRENGERYRGRGDDTLWPEVGKAYLGAMTYWSDDEGWGVVNPAALTLFENGRVAVPADEFSPIAAVESLKGLSAKECAAVLASVRPDPVAASLLELLPRERYAAVLEARHTVDTTSPRGS